MKTTLPRQGRIVALVGAESTGKTTLAQDLFRALLARGHDAVVVPETLRTFCDTQGRTPRADEQAALAAEHSRRIREAAERHTLVLADTTALMTAVYSDLLFDGAGLAANTPTGLDGRNRVPMTDSALSLVLGPSGGADPASQSRDQEIAQAPAESRNDTEQNAHVKFPDGIPFGAGPGRSSAR